MAEQRGFRGVLAMRRLSWRHFWARRQRWRIALAVICGLAALFIVVYMVIPSDIQRQVNETLLATVGIIGALKPAVALAAIAGLLAILCLILIFARSYHRASYFAASPSAVPRISVYIDAENQLPEYAIRGFTKFLMEYLDGRRADLLYFLDASRTATGPKYKTLYRFGFRPVDVPHDPTGTVSVKEAVDKELALHAYERALVGPQKQEFIIVTGDQDFVALVYRLAALGHHVQVWATPILSAYRTLATYLDIDLIDLSHVVAESESSSQRKPTSLQKAKPAREKARRKPATTPRITLDDPSLSLQEPTLLSEAGEQQIYRAVVRTLKVREDCEARFTNPAQRANSFRAKLGGELAPRLAGIGYSAASKIDYWIDHLTATGALGKQGTFPKVGTASPMQAAQALFIVAQLAAQAAMALDREHGDQPFSTSDLANELLAHQGEERGAVHNLLQLIARNNPRRATHARYFVRTAQALGVIEFEDAPNSVDLIRSPRLLDSLPLPSAEETSQESLAPSIAIPDINPPGDTAGVYVDGADGANPVATLDNIADDGDNISNANRDEMGGNEPLPESIPSSGAC